VSPLWRDEVGVFLAPRRVLINRMRRGLRPTCVADRTLPVEGGGFNDWGPSLAVLGAELRDPCWHDANVRFVVANHWVRFTMIPWSADLSDDEERLAHGRLLMHEVFGDAVNDWTLALGEAAAGQPQLACAMPSLLKTELSSMAASAKLRMVSLQPHLVVSFNRWRQRLPEAGGWLVVIDDGTLAALRLGRSGWEEVHCVRIGTDWSAELKRLQTFARLAGASAGSTAEGRKVMVEAPFWLRTVAADCGEMLEWLKSDEGSGGTLERLAQLAEINA